MKYYKLLMDASGENDIVCHYRDSFDIQEYELCEGKNFNNWNENFEFYFDSAEGNVATDYLANDMTWFVVSQKLKDALDELNTKVQYFKVKIKEETGNQLIEDYYVANIINLVDSLCLDESDYFETNIDGIGTIYSISKFAIYENKVQENDVFKLPNRQEIPIFVSERFKKIVEQRNITGMEFLEVKTV